PEIFVTTSVDIAPKWGEYERVTATALNAYLGPVMGGYLGRLDTSLRELGYAHGLQITQCGGGTVPVARAGEAPLLTLDSGPVSGVTASMFLGAAMGHKNVITTDMGGTSFDVSIIYEGKPAYSFISNTDQYEYFLPKVDLQAIGAGGGSLARVQPEARTMTVGPDSAGAFPGPVCYSRGGTVPAHAGVFARELGVAKVIVPQRKAASTWCAFGAAAADVLHIFEHTEIMPTPVPAERINDALAGLEKNARQLMADEGISAD